MSVEGQPGKIMLKYMLKKGAIYIHKYIYPFKSIDIKCKYQITHQDTYGTLSM